MVSTASKSSRIKSYEHSKLENHNWPWLKHRFFNGRYFNCDVGEKTQGWGRWRRGNLGKDAEWRLDWSHEVEHSGLLYAVPLSRDQTLSSCYYTARYSSVSNFWYDAQKFEVTTWKGFTRMPIQESRQYNKSSTYILVDLSTNFGSKFLLPYSFVII